ncbi:MAG: AAA family ATPase [Deltaproteobacteria bacterium]|nr:AAA family ATPase [Deltaproteobacteria bacterium]
MHSIYISTTGDHAGQSLLTWSIGLRLMEKNFRVGFIKPFGTQPFNEHDAWIDRDASLFKQVFNLPDPIKSINPYPFSEEAFSSKDHERHDSIIKRIKGLCEELSAEKDILLIMGSSHIFYDHSSATLPDITLIHELEADCILINRYIKSSTTIYSILSVSSLLKERLKGIFINRVHPDSYKEVRDKMATDFINRGIPITAVIREDPFLSYLSIREVTQLLGGELLCGDQQCLNVPIGGMTVGSSDLTGELKIFKRAYNKILLLDPSSTSMEGEDPDQPRKIAGILLTGGVKPAHQLLSASQKEGIPLILIQEDTFKALEVLEKGVSSICPEDDLKVRYFSEMIDKEGAFEKLLQSFL